MTVCWRLEEVLASFAFAVALVSALGVFLLLAIPPPVPPVQAYMLVMGGRRGQLRRLSPMGWLRKPLRLEGVGKGH